MEKKSLGRSFLILSFAGIFIKILSALYVPLLNAIIGKEAYAVYGASYSILVFVLAVTTMGMQPAITKVVAELRALGNTIDALRAMKLARKYMAIIGGIFTILLIVLADNIAKFANWEKAIISIRFLAPTILLSCILAAYRGYLQGIEDMESIGISQILEQMVNVVLSLVFAALLIKNSTELGVAGGTVGTSLGALVAIVYIIYIHSKRNYDENAYESNTVEKRLSNKRIAKKLIAYGLPITLVAILQNASSLVDTFIVKSRLLDAGFTEVAADGLFANLGYYNTLLYVPLALVTALSTAIFPKVIAAYAERNKREIKTQISYAYRITFMITVPACFGLSLLSSEVYQLLFSEVEGAKLMLYASIVLIFMSITTIQNTILQGVNKLYLVLNTAFLGVIVKFILDFTLVGINSINIFGAVIASFCAYLVPAILNHINLNKTFKIRIPVVKQLIAPIISSIVMSIGIVVLRMPLRRLINILEGGRIMIGIEIVILIAIGGSIYFVTMIALGGIRKKDLNFFSPKLYRMLPRFLRKMM